MITINKSIKPQKLTSSNYKFKQQKRQLQKIKQKKPKTLLNNKKRFVKKRSLIKRKYKKKKNVLS